MRHGSLFSGIGGFDLAAEWMGWENVFHCEWNKFGQQVLHYYWPKAICYEDITKTDFSIHTGTIDIISGGFPCQPYSSAGKRLGKEDERHLWPEMLRAIREIQPRWVVGENVRGLTNWNGGMVFDEVQSDLEAEGYQVTPFLLPACAVNAPHRRDRIWFVAYSNKYSKGSSRESNSIEREWGNGHIQQKQWGEETEFDSRLSSISRDASNSEFIRLEHCTNSGQIQREKTDARGERGESSLSTKTNGNGHKPNWENFPTVSPICNGDDGISDRLDSITFPKWRNESIKAGGNAVVPQVVLQIFKAIEQYERIRTPNTD